jgi:hypothetical protein
LSDAPALTLATAFAASTASRCALYSSGIVHADAFVL